MALKEVKTDRAPAAIGPYSQAISAGGFVYASGQIPVNPATGLIEARDIGGQALQAFENLKNVLEAAGSGLSKVIKTTVFIKDMNDFARINEIYSGFFSAPYPARSCVEAARLPKDVLIEIEAIAEI
jgi:2-iminobutanoate/2-iminopropanoate deaminase